KAPAGRGAEPGGDAEPPFHPAGVPARDPVGSVDEADELEQLADALAQRRAGHAVDAALQEQVLAAGRLPVDAGVLSDVSDRAPDALRVADDVLAGDERAARVRLRQCRERAHR